MLLYRLLRGNENFQFGLSANDPNSNVAVFNHVAYGSNGPDSKYISTCGSLEAVRRFASNSWNGGMIVSLNTDLAPGVEVIDLRDLLVRNNYIPQNASAEALSRFNNFATAFEEVLLVGNIPANCIQLIEIYQKNPQMLQFNMIKI